MIINTGNYVWNLPFGQTTRCMKKIMHAYISAKKKKKSTELHFKLNKYIFLWDGLALSWVTISFKALFYQCILVAWVNAGVFYYNFKLFP